MLGQDPCAGPGQGAVDDRQEAAAPLARQALRQFEVAPRRRIDLHDRLRQDALRRLQIGAASLLGQCHVIDERTGGGDLRAAELAEPVERPDPVKIFKAPPRRFAVEARVGERR